MIRLPLESLKVTDRLSSLSLGLPGAGSLRRLAQAGVASGVCSVTEGLDLVTHAHFAAKESEA